MRSWTERAPWALTGALALGLFVGCDTPPPAGRGAPSAPLSPTAASTASACAEAARHVAEGQRALSAGRLLIAAAHAAAKDPACPGEASALARLGEEVSSGLGEGAVGPARFAPDGPVEALAGDAEARAAYDRAAAAYRGSDWASAGKLGLSVGAHRGPLSGEGFILAAVSAERAGDAPRAARMWARASAQLCRGQGACSVRPPQEDVFTRAARYGGFTPWYAADLCASGAPVPMIVRRTWEVTPEEGALLVREIPTRVLLERIETPPDAALVCLSRDGRRRAAHIPRTAQRDHAILVGAEGAPWVSVPLGSQVWPEAVLQVGEDGKVVIPQGIHGDKNDMALLQPPSTAVQRSSWTPKLAEPVGSLGAGGVYLAASLEVVKGERQIGLARYRLGEAKGATIVDKLPQPVSVGPIDDQGRALVLAGSKALSIEVATGKVLAEMPDPTLSSGSRDRGWLGVTGPGTLAWIGGDPPIVKTANVATGVVEEGGVVGRLPAAVAEVSKWIAALPVGSRRLGDVPGWSVLSREGVEVKLQGSNMGVLRVILTADRKGAMVIAKDGRFEVVGEVHPAFRASAACKGAGGKEGIAPLPVCAAALEDPGLLSAWCSAMRPSAQGG